MRIIKNDAILHFPYKPVGFVKQMMIGRSPDFRSLLSCAFPITLSDIYARKLPYTVAGTVTDFNRSSLLSTTHVAHLTRVICNFLFILKYNFRKTMQNDTEWILIKTQKIRSMEFERMKWTQKGNRN